VVVLRGQSGRYNRSNSQAARLRAVECGGVSHRWHPTPVFSKGLQSRGANVIQLRYINLSKRLVLKNQPALAR